MPASSWNSENISWPSLWRAGYAACCVARCRTPPPTRRLCGAESPVCTGGKYSGRERPENRDSFDIPFADIDLRLFGTATNAFSSTGSTRFPRWEKSHYPFLSFAFKTDLGFAGGMQSLTEASRGRIVVDFGLSVFLLPTNVTASPTTASARPRGKEARRRGIVPRNARLCLDAGGLPGRLFS